MFSLAKDWKLLYSIIWSNVDAYRVYINGVLVNLIYYVKKGDENLQVHNFACTSLIHLISCRDYQPGSNFLVAFGPHSILLA